MAVLDKVADRQAQWSQTADSLKKSLGRARWWVFFLSVSGALAASIASQIGPSGAPVAVGNFANPRGWAAIAGVLCLAFSTFLVSRLLGAASVSNWARARAISEGLKREAFRFATRSAPYDDPDPDKNETKLDDERRGIEDDGADLIASLVAKSGSGSTPRMFLGEPDYRALRVQKAIDWYRRKGGEHRKTATRLGRTEFALSAVATVVTALSTISGKWTIGGVQLDFLAFTAVLTTLGGAILAHVEALRLHDLVMTYFATARRLEDKKDRPGLSFSALVSDCEDIIATENSGWIAKWTKD